jgi:hypothetical protein
MLLYIFKDFLLYPGLYIHFLYLFTVLSQLLSELFSSCFTMLTKKQYYDLIRSDFVAHLNILFRPSPLY